LSAHSEREQNDAIEQRDPLATGQSVRVQISCADCGCIVDRGVVRARCADPGCCCRDLPDEKPT
jgi:hypothetical protein